MVREILIIVAAVIACVFAIQLSDECQMLKNDNQRLKKQVGDLESKLNEVQFGAERMLVQAKVCIQSKDWTGAEDNLRRLLARHKTSSESIEAAELLVVASEEAKKKRAEDEEQSAAAEVERKKKEDQANKERQQKYLQATGNMRSDTDEVKRITWYRDKSTPKTPLGKCIYLYFGRQGDTVLGPRLCVQYRGDHWVFADKYVVRADEDVFDIVPDRVSREAGYGAVWESSDQYVDSGLMEKVTKIIKSSKATLRFDGRDKVSDMTISTDEKQAMARVVFAYEAARNCIK